jgi:G:T-mismatch repair DNA endonuclease (very short patch repair protein)
MGIIVMFDFPKYPLDIIKSKKALFIEYIVDDKLTSIHHRVTKEGLHNLGLPAIYFREYDLIWAIHGTIYRETKAYCYDAGFDDETTTIWLLSYGTTLPDNIDDVRQLNFTFRVM